MAGGLIALLEQGKRDALEVDGTVWATIDTFAVFFVLPVTRLGLLSLSRPQQVPGLRLSYHHMMRRLTWPAIAGDILRVPLFAVVAASSAMRYLR